MVRSLISRPPTIRILLPTASVPRDDLECIANHQPHSKPCRLVQGDRSSTHGPLPRPERPWRNASSSRRRKISSTNAPPAANAPIVWRRVPNPYRLAPFASAFPLVAAVLPFSCMSDRSTQIGKLLQQDLPDSGLQARSQTRMPGVHPSAVRARFCTRGHRRHEVRAESCLCSGSQRWRRLLGVYQWPSRC